MGNQGWMDRSLGDVVALEYGAALPAQKRIGDAVPVFGSNGEVGRHNFALVQGPGIVIGRKGTVGALTWSNDDFWPIDTTYYVRPHGEISMRWLYWALSALGLNRLDSSTGVPGLSRSDAYELRLRIPPVLEQCRIAEILDTLDYQISVVQQIIRKLTGCQHSILHDLTSEDWPLHRLGDLAQHVTSGSRGWARYYADNGAKFIRIGNLTRSHINLRFDSVVRVMVPSGVEGSRTGLQAGDLLISITADLGIIGVVPDNLGEAYINQHIALVRVDPVKANSRWLGHYLSSLRGQNQFRRLNDQGAKAGLNLPTVANLEVALPSPDEQARCVATLDSIDALIMDLDHELAKLRFLRLGVVSDLLSDRVGVSQESLS